MESNAQLLLSLAEAVVLGYPVLAVIGDIPSDERDTEVLASSHFRALDWDQQGAFTEAAIVRFRNIM
jgi:hypothetical protein